MQEIKLTKLKANKTMYKPYETENLIKLMQFFYAKGWYGGTLDLLTITMKGGFEAFTGRASETWEHKFFVKNCAIPEIGIFENEASGETLDDACQILLQILELPYQTIQKVR